MVDRVFSAFPNLEIASKCYAMTETCGPSALAYPSLQDASARKHSQGVAVPGAEIRIVDPVTSDPQPPGVRGEIRIRGPLLFAGYFEMEEETRASFDPEGWFRTGDLGRLDPEGRLFFDGRLKRLIKTGGENVSEREVEVFLEDKIPGVNIAQVVGVPDPLWGEAVVAFIEPQRGAEVNESKVRMGCKGKLADYKIPKRVWLLSETEWPRNDVGKISKDALVALATAADHVVLE
jgi:acyl-CoA synthetase (AMP-forming)/AMP-acid ligase II